MAAKTLLDAVLEANLARARGDASARAALPPGAMPFVITCMDPRLAGTLMPAMGLCDPAPPQAKFAGAVVRPGDVSGIRSVLAAALFNMATEVLVVGHTDCRMGKISALDVRSGLARLGVRPEAFQGQDPPAWLGVFSGEAQAVRASVDALRSDPRMPPAIVIHGLLYNLHSGRLEVLVRGYEAARTAGAEAAMASPGGYTPGPVSLGAPPPPTFGVQGLSPPPGPAAGVAGPVSFGTPGATFPHPPAPVSLGPPPPPIVPPGGVGPPPSFPAPPPMAAPPSPAPEPPPPEAEEPPPPPRKPGGKRKKGDSPFDRAMETLERMRRDRDR